MRRHILPRVLTLAGLALGELFAWVESQEGDVAPLTIDPRALELD